MPSEFELELSTSLPYEIYGTFDVSATYNDPNGSTPISTTVKIHRNPSREVATNTRISKFIQDATLYVLQSSISRPVPGGRFSTDPTGNPEVWTIETVPVLKAGQFACTCSRGGPQNVMPKRETN